MRMMSLRPVQRGSAALLTLLALGACSRGSADAADGAASTPSDAARSYQLVTQLRPESPELFFRPARAVYDLCVASARAKGLQVKPFPALPKEFVAAKTIYASDGKRKFFKETEWKIDHGPDFGADTGCEMRLASQWRSEVIDGANARSAGRTDDGQFMLEEMRPAGDETVHPDRLSGYAQAKVVNGIKLKCNVDETCIVDPAVAMIGFGSRPAMAAARTDDPRTPLLLEPVSLTVDKAIDPALFKQENAE